MYTFLNGAKEVLTRHVRGRRRRSTAPGNDMAANTKITLNKVSTLILTISQLHIRSLFTFSVPFYSLLRGMIY